MFLVAHFLGALVAGTLITALIAWVLSKISNGTSEVRFFFAFILASGIAFWGWSGDGAPVLTLASYVLSNAVGASINYTLSRRRKATEQDVEAFD